MHSQDTREIYFPLRIRGLLHSDAFLVHLGGDRTGAPKTNRTSDLPLRRGLLYPLSYRGVDRPTAPITGFYRDRAAATRDGRGPVTPP